VAPACLDSLCDARQALVNISQCSDTVQQQELLVQQYEFLATTPAFSNRLRGFQECK